jgi:hypothetical protein
MPLKSIFLWAALSVGILACDHAQPAPTETNAPTPPDPGAVGQGDPSPAGSIDEALAPPAELAVEAWERVPGISSVALRGCALQSDGFAKCSFTAANGFEARVHFRTFDSSASTQFECESRAGVAAGPTLQLGAGYARWETGDAVLVATESLCVSVQVFQNGAFDRDETLRVSTELADNAASIARDETPAE